jgi:predicted RNA binding protein YcfA (HicA-like mRNA interferase family)
LRISTIYDINKLGVNLVAKIDKKIQKLFDAPRSISSRELISILLSLDFIEKSAKGSHRLFKHPQLNVSLTIPDQNPLKIAYISKARRYIEQARELQKNG